MKIFELRKKIENEVKHLIEEQVLWKYRKINENITKESNKRKPERPGKEISIFSGKSVQKWFKFQNSFAIESQRKEFMIFLQIKLELFGEMFDVESAKRKIVDLPIT